MHKKVDFRKLKWIYQPEFFALHEEKLILETEPHTDLKPLGRSAEAIELSYAPLGSFCFTVRTDFHYRGRFDQCGIIIYQGKKRIAVVSTQYHDEETIRLNSIVFHHSGGDTAGSDIGEAICWMYYRVWYRAGAFRIQFSYNGDRFTDMRIFRVDPDLESVIYLGVYACSPGNSYFDCTFSEMTLDEDQITESRECR